MKKRLTKIIIALILYIISFIIKFENVWITNVIFIISYIIVGFDILKKAIRDIFRGKLFDENFLMSIATIGAFAIGEFPEAVAVMLFYQIGELFQSYAVNQSRKSISSLMDLRPDFANVYKIGQFEKTDIEDVKIGDIIIIKPGEKVPLDGCVIDGKTFLDTKALTGESVPIEANVGDEVLSGFINLDGVIKLKITKAFSESTVSKLLDLVENASSKKSKSENFITKFSKYYTPAVVIIALFLAILPPIFINNASFSDWLYRALSFLVVSCPCALVISIPLSFFGGIGGASKMGILIKGSNYLEALSNVETMVFDKTGTLTKGVFEVQKIEPFGIAKEDLLKMVAYCEYFSNHPIAKSIKQAYGEQIAEQQILNAKELSGYGISATVFGKNVYVGNEKLMNNEQIQISKCDDIGTVIYVAIDKKYAGYILISDELKPDSKMALENIKKYNVKQTVMLTGDKKSVAEYFCEKLGVDKFFSELLPDGKVFKLEELLKSTSGKVAYVGDGINDAPVLALSDIGIAMGGLGSDSAIEAADIVIMTDEPSKIVDAIKLSKKTMRIVYENIIFAIFVKISILILSAFGLSTMWEAVFADVGVSVIAILNALRVLHNK